MTLTPPDPIIPCPSAPACAQCGAPLSTRAGAERNVWGRVCQTCDEAGRIPAAPPIPSLWREKPHVPLGPQSGPDGNVYVVIGAVMGALRAVGQHDQARAFQQQAHACHHYAEVLALARTMVDLTFEEE
jgi:hypothetical protein